MKFKHSSLTLTLGRHNETPFASHHSHSEVDHIHSLIERSKKHVKVHIPSDWYNVIANAKHSNRITVDSLEHQDFLNIKEFVTTSSLHLRSSVAGEKINWLKIKQIKIQKGCEYISV